MSRRWHVATTLLLFGVVILAPLNVKGQQPPLSDQLAGGGEVTPEAQQAIDRGLAFLAAQQNEDGTYGERLYGRNVAVCSLATLALLSSGSTPGRGPYGAEVQRSIDYLLANTSESGYIAAPAASSYGPMYGHGFATLALAEVYGMTSQPDLHRSLSNAVRLILDTQNDTGGWRYQAERSEADISVTVCQVMALRAARNAGIYVPEETIRRAIEYVTQSQNNDGGFCYMLNRSESGFSRSAAGLVALYSAGVYEGREVEAALAYLQQFLPVGEESLEESYFYYGHYYAAQAMWQAGGNRWEEWYPAISQLLQTQQRSDGSWFESNFGPEYATAMALLVLQVPNDYLPIFQR